MQPYFFPYLGYFQLIKAVDKFVLYDDVNFINRGWINRNNILINGKATLISVPLRGASQNKLIKDICPFEDLNWRNKLLKTIEHNYKKASEFEVIFPLLQHIINSDANSISELNYVGIKTICEYLGVNTTIISSSAIFNNSDLKGQNRIIDICKKVGANHYINPSGGTELYDPISFALEGISLNFLKSELPSYKQLSNEFISSLSIIDVLMFNPLSKISSMLLKYKYNDL